MGGQICLALRLIESHSPGKLVVTGIHAYQGDGEIAGSLEAAGEVDLKPEVIKGVTEPCPILETDDRWYAIASCDTLEDRHTAGWPCAVRCEHNSLTFVQSCAILYS